jgi:hypothetical protein
MIKRIFVSLLFAGVISAAFAQGQDQTVPPKPAYEAFPSAVGVFAVSFPGEGGLQYQVWLGSFGFQTMGGILYNMTLFNSKTFDYWIEVEGLWRIYGDRFGDWLSGQLYLWARAGHEGYIEQIVDYPTDPATGQPSTTPVISSSPFVPVIIGGAGIGLEIILFEHFSLPFEFGYEGLYPFGYSTPLVGFGVSGGLRYRF